MGVKDIVTEDGTELKAGMVSGGIHTNIFNINLGTFRIDNEIKHLVDEIQSLDSKLTDLRKKEKEYQSHTNKA